MKSIIIKSLLAAALLLPFAVNALPIQGDIGITGTLLPSCSNGPEGDCDMAVADGLTFTTPGLVVGATGDFATTIGFGDEVAMSDFIFAPFDGVDPLWSVGGFSFALETLTIMGQTSTQLLMTGTGTISFDNCPPGSFGCQTRVDALDPTMGNWSFSADQASGAITFAWSSTTAAVPEPGILFLMALGLIGGLGARRLTRS